MKSNGPDQSARIECRSVFDPNLFKHVLKPFLQGSCGPRHAKNVSSGICGQRRPRSTCASAHDQGLHCPLSVSMDTIECMNTEQRPG